jgi:hypothetical protein
MTPLPATVTDAELIAFIDRWAALMEQEDYEAAFDFTDHMDTGWDPEGIQEVVKAYGDADPNQRVTLAGVPTDVQQRKEVDRWPDTNPYGYFGEIWYDLNIDGQVSDLTATFALRRTEDGGVAVHLNDIHVM